MDNKKDNKRKKDRNEDDDDHRRENKSKRARSRSRSPAESRERDNRRKRRHSRSRSNERPVKQEKQQDDAKAADVKKDVPERKAKETDMLNTRTGGAYIPPARLRMMQAQITDKSSVAYQRLAWEALKKSIHGHINKINVGNIGIIIKELLKENIVRGRGLLCRSVIQAQAASPTFTNVYAALVAAVNSRFPNIGELLLKRLVIQFKRGFKRNDKPTCISSASFIAHLVNQRVAHEILALELLTLLVETPTDDSVEVAIAFLKECGQKLTEVSSKGVNAIFEMLRNILHEGQLDKRVQYMIEVMFQVWKDGFKDHPALIEELELVPEEEQFTHLLMLDEATDAQDILNVFKFDDKYEENEQKYKTLSRDILGSDADTDAEDGSGESGSEESEEEEAEDEEQKDVTIIDKTETNLVALRRTIYLTINSSLDFEECAHKLMKMQLKPGQEVELCHMFLDCCAEQRTYEKFYGLLAQRFCNINRIYIGPFEEIFKDSYSTAHRLDTNRLRNVSKFFAHLLFTDSISWEVLECVKLNEEDTTSSSRIYIKILFQELAEYMGLKKLNDRLKDPTLQEAFRGIFPRDNPKNTRFSINFFTSIGLGGLTDELREHLKQMPKNVPAPITDINLASESSSDSSSSSSSSDDSDSSSSDSSSSDSEDESSKKKEGGKDKKSKKKKDKAPKTPDEEEPKSDTERWGHDGFYDTYGKDARRIESRPDRDNFARPQDRRNDDRNRNREEGRIRNREDERTNREDDKDRNRDDYRNRRDFEQQNGEFRREDRRRDDRRQDDRRQNDRRQDERRQDERRQDDRRQDERRQDERRQDDRRQDERRQDERRQDERRQDERRQDERRQDDRRQEDRRQEDRRQEDRRQDERRQDNRKQGDRRQDDKEFRRNNDDRQRDDRNGDREISRRRDYEDRRERNGEDSRSRRESDVGEPRTRGEDLDNRSKKDSRSQREDESRFRRENVEDNYSKRNDRDSRKETDANEEIKSKRREETETRNNKGKDKVNRKQKNSEESSDDASNKNKKDKRKKDLDVSEEMTKSKRKEKNKSSKDKKKSKQETSDESTSTEEEEQPEKEKRNKKSKHKHKDDNFAKSKKDRKHRSDSEDSSDSEEDDKKDKKRRRKKERVADSSEEEQYEKENRKHKNKDKHSEEDSDDESRRRKREKGKKKEKKTDGWDIRRGSSLRREVPTGRYWDNK